MEKEIRKYSGEVRSEQPGHISGYCCRFNEPSKNMGFVEEIRSGAITQEMIDNGDIFCLFNHDADKVLGRSLRSVGNLKLTVDDQGVRYDCALLDNQLSQTVRSYVDAGLINTSSFAFIVSDSEGAQEWRRDPEGVIHRTINKMEGIYDASPVWSAAYDTTSCTCRSYEKFLEEEEKRSKEEEPFTDPEIELYKQRINELNN